MTTLLLGVRLAMRGARVRVAVTALALAFAVAFLLSVLGALPARQAKLDRLAARAAVAADERASAGHAAPSATTQLSGLYGWWRGQTLGGYRVVQARQGQPVPPGVRRLPRPGELVVSPALAAALRGTHGAELAPRLPGRVVGEIAEEGLSGPRELYAYVGVAQAPKQLPGFAAAGFGREVHRAGVGPELRVAAQLGAVGLLLPVLVLVATASRLSAATRDRRLAAVRLVGGSPRQVALLVSGEALLVGAFGAAAGLAVFLALRPVAARLVPVAGGVFAGDLMAPAWQVAGSLLLVPLGALLVSLLGMRRLVIDPLGVRRSGRPKGRAGLWRLLPLTSGLALLGALWVRHRDLVGVDVVLLLGGGALTLLGLAVIAPVVSRLAGAGLARLPGVAARLAGRRLQADPSATSRTLTGTVLVVFVGTWLLAFLPILSASQSSDERTLAQALPGSTISASVGSSLSAPVEATLASTRGVRHVLVVRTALLAKPGVLKVDDTTSPDDYPSQVAVVACADLAAMLGTTLPCQAGRVLHVRFPRSFAQAAPPTGDLVATDGNGVALGAVALPAAVDVDLGRVGPALLLQSETAVDPSLLPRKALDAFGARLLITTDGQPATTERLRNVLDAAGILGASTLAEQLADQDRVVLGYQRATRLGLLLAVLVGGVGLLASSLDAVRARRRDLAALAAFGVPTGVLRRALLLEVLAPLLGCTALALGSGVFAAVAYLAADTFYRDEVGLPWRQWSGVGGLAVLVVLVVTAVTLPAAGRAARPSSLRVE